ncbi:DUF433 domain-containing protein [candidate division KSB1 bacterium]|nr:DUF433 domain-containing protein [candidate division KSB1 bacterium]
MPFKIADHIEIDTNVHHGKPVVAGTRIPVQTVLGLLSNGVTPEEISRDFYEHLTREDILACIRYANSLIADETIHPILA